MLIKAGIIKYFSLTLSYREAPTSIKILPRAKDQLPGWFFHFITDTRISSTLFLVMVNADPQAAERL